MACGGRAQCMHGKGELVRRPSFFSLPMEKITSAGFHLLSKQ